MICYRDRAFCLLSNKCKDKKCNRNFNNEDQNHFRSWAESIGKTEDTAPISYSDFNEGCLKE